MIRRQAGGVLCAAAHIRALVMCSRRGRGESSVDEKVIAAMNLKSPPASAAQRFENTAPAQKVNRLQASGPGMTTDAQH